MTFIEGERIDALKDSIQRKDSHFTFKESEGLECFALVSEKRNDTTTFVRISEEYAVNRKDQSEVEINLNTSLLNNTEETISIYVKEHKGVYYLNQLKEFELFNDKKPVEAWELYTFSILESGNFRFSIFDLEVDSFILNFPTQYYEEILVPELIAADTKFIVNPTDEEFNKIARLPSATQILEGIRLRPLKETGASLNKLILLGIILSIILGATMYYFFFYKRKKTTKDISSIDTEKIKEQIVKNNLLGTFEEIKKHSVFYKNNQSEIDLIESNFHSANKKNNLNLITHEEFGTQESKTVSALLSLLQRNS